MVNKKIISSLTQARSQQHLRSNCRKDFEVQKYDRLNLWSEIRKVLKTAFAEKLSSHQLIDKIRSARI